MTSTPQRAGVAPPVLIGGLAVATLVTFALSLILIAMTFWRTTRSFGRLAIAANALLFLAGIVLAGEQLAGYFLVGDA